MSLAYTPDELDVLRELSNIGAGTAATALSHLLGREVDISIASAAALPPADAVEATGDPEAIVRAVLLPIAGGLEALVLLLFPPADAARLCALLGADADSDVGSSALAEIGNILGTSYINALAAMTGLELEPRPPQTATDLLGAVVGTALLLREDAEDALVLDCELTVEGEQCSLSFLMLPAADGVGRLLGRAGL
jgi:chemotaxis protein CheC